MAMLTVLLSLFGLSMTGVVALAGGAAGLVYLAIYALALVPGLPLGFKVFSRRHALGWIVGGAIGYFLTSLAIWMVIAAHVASAFAFMIAWALMGLLSWLASRAFGDSRFPVAAWTTGDTRALLLVLLLVPAIAGPPFARVGATDADGNRYYRAYFTADFVWHTALTAEVKKFSMPPRNPFMASRPIHYYWTYYLLPAAVSGAGPRWLGDVEGNLKVNAIATAALLVCAMFAAAWAAVPRAGAVAAATALAIVASSAEGFFAVARFWQRGEPLGPALRDVNIDAIANWWFGGLRVDGIQRCFWWVPQHSTAYALGLASFAVATAAGSAAPRGAIVVAGIALAGAVAFNPFVGGVLSLAWGLGIAIDALTSGEPVRRLLRHAIAAVPVLGALAWCASTRMFEGAVGVLEFGLRGDAAHAPLSNLLLSLGPALVPACAGIALAIGAQRMDLLRRAALPVSLTLVALSVMHFVRLGVDISWVGFRGGQMVLVAVPALVALGFALPKPWRIFAVAAATVACLVGLPTTAIDEFNAQDISNRRPGPGFPWTEVLDRPHTEAMDWLRRATPPTAIVQQDALARDRTTWWIVPTFGHRRMAAGLPPFMVNVPEYREKSERVRTIYATADAHEAWAAAHALGIDYIYTDEVERTAYSRGMAKFEDRRYFIPAFSNDAVQLFRVQ